MNFKKVILFILATFLLSDMLVAMSKFKNIPIWKYKEWGRKNYQDDLKTSNYYAALMDTSGELIKTIEKIGTQEVWKSIKNAIQTYKNGIDVSYKFYSELKSGEKKKAEGKLHFQHDKISELTYSSDLDDGYTWKEEKDEMQTFHPVKSTFTPLGSACLWGKLKIAKQYLKLGGDPNVPVKLFAGTRVYLEKYPMHMTLDWYKITNQDKLKQAYLDLVGFLMLKDARLDIGESGNR